MSSEDVEPKEKYANNVVEKAIDIYNCYTFKIGWINSESTTER